MQSSAASNKSPTQANGWVAKESNFEAKNMETDYSVMATWALRPHDTAMTGDRPANHRRIQAALQERFENTNLPVHAKILFGVTVVGLGRSACPEWLVVRMNTARSLVVAFLNYSVHN